MKFGPLAFKYLGDEADGYEQKRAGAKWRAEDSAAHELLEGVAHGARALDVPVGTGRLLGLMQARSFRSIGLDISPDMLAIAKTRADEIDASVELGIGDIRNIPFEDNRFDLVTCLRFLNWIDAKGVEEVVRELARVTSNKLLVGVRYIAPLKELNQGRLPLIRLAFRALGVHRLHAFHTGLHYHSKAFIKQLFERVGLDVVQARFIERRIDGTDYVFFLLQKRTGRTVQSNHLTDAAHAVLR